MEMTCPRNHYPRPIWNDFEEPIVGTLIPNFFITYFGQDLPHGVISDNKIKANSFVWALDMNYGPTLPTMLSRNWMTSLVSWRKSKLRNPSRSTSTQSGCKVPPSCHMKWPLWHNDLSPVGRLSCCSPCYVGLIPTLSTGGRSDLASRALSNVMLHLPAEVNKESEAKKGILKLMLLHIHGNINIKATSVSNIIPAIQSKGMQVVLNQPCAA